MISVCSDIMLCLSNLSFNWGCVYVEWRAVILFGAAWM